MIYKCEDCRFRRRNPYVSPCNVCFEDPGRPCWRPLRWWQR